MNLSNLESIYKPFDDINQFYIAVYLYYKFENLEKTNLNQLIEIIKNMTNNKNLSFTDFKWFVDKVKLNSKQYYATNFFKNFNYLESQIESYLILNNVKTLSFRLV